MKGSHCTRSTRSQITVLAVMLTFALVASSLVMAAPVSAATIGLAPTAAAPIALADQPYGETTSDRTIQISNATGSPVQLAYVSATSTDPAVTISVYSIGSPGPGSVIAPGEQFTAYLFVKSDAPGPHTASLDIGDSVYGEWPGTVHDGSWTINFTATGMLTPSLTISGPPSARHGADVTLTGSLTDSVGPVASAPVAISRIDSLGTTNLPSATTDSAGSFSVTTPMGSSNATFRATFSDATHLSAQSQWTIALSKDPSTITVVAPVSSLRGTTFTVSGVLTSGGTAVVGAPLAITVKTLLGINQLARTTSATGAYSFPLRPTVGGDITITVSWAGDLDRAAVTTTRHVTVPRTATTLTIHADRSVYTYRSTATITVHLGATYNNRVVSMYARPLGTAPGKLLVRARVNSAGNLVVRHTMTRRTTFTVTFAGDYRYEPASRTVSPNVRTVVGVAMTAYSAYSDGYYLYRAGSRGTDPQWTVSVVPSRPGGCLRLTAQMYRSGRWVTLEDVRCFRFDSASRSYLMWNSDRVRGTKFRIQASVSSNTYSTSGVSLWRYFTFV
jgi:hypothetical protein